MDKNRTVVVAGPTASGKTSLAVELAQAISGEIVSADSRQVYRGMDLGTGKDIHEYTTTQGSIPYHLIDIVDPEMVYTLYNYQRDCYSALQNCFDRDTTPLICGGTGLYIEAVLKQYKIPNVPENTAFRTEHKLLEKEVLVERLKNEALDIYSETDILSKKRVIRALEIADYRKTNTVHYSSDNAMDLSPVILITEWEVDALKKRISKRMHERFEEGMIDEVQTLRDRGISDARLDLLGMEYRAINRHLVGELSYAEMTEHLQFEIYRLAKRQRTWFRGMERRGFTVHTIPEASSNVAMDILRKEEIL